MAYIFGRLHCTSVGYSLLDPSFSHSFVACVQTFPFLFVVFRVKQRKYELSAGRLAKQ